MSPDRPTVAKYLDNTQEITADSIVAEPAERRRFVRRSAHWRVTFTTKDKRLFHGKTRDVSEKGTSIFTDINLPSKTPIYMVVTVFYQGKKANYKVLGEVRHTSIAKDGFTLGVLFKECEEEATTFFKKYAEGQI